MNTRFKFFFLLISMMLCVSLNSWAYDDWTSTDNSTSYFWDNIRVSANKYLLVDYETNGGEDEYLTLGGYYIRGKKTGTYILKNTYSYTYSYSLNASYKKTKGSDGYCKVYNIRIADSAPKFTSISIGNNFDLAINSSKDLTVTSVPLYSSYSSMSQNVTWTSSNPSVATVSSSGRVIGVSVGSATITCTANDGSGVSGSCNVTVKKVEKITLDDTYIGINDHKKKLSFSVSPICCPQTASNYTWVSSDEKIVSVNNSGEIYCYKVGTAIITVSANDGSGVNESCYVTVTPGYSYGVEGKVNYAYTDSRDYLYVNTNGSLYYNVDKDYTGGNYFLSGYGTTNVGDELHVNFTVDNYTRLNIGNDCNFYYGCKEYSDGCVVTLNGTPLSSNSSNNWYYFDNGTNLGNHIYNDIVFSSGTYDLVIKYNEGTGDSEKDFMFWPSISLTPVETTTFNSEIQTIDVVKVNREGILGAEALKIHDNLTDFKGLKVIGPLDEYDWKTIGEMGLTCLDLTEASGVYPSSGNFSTIKAVKMSNNIVDIEKNYFSQASYVYVPDGVKYVHSGIGNKYGVTLEGCKGVQHIYNEAFKDFNIMAELSLDNLEFVDKDAFYNCKSLGNVKMPKVKVIESNSFKNCIGLKAISIDNVSRIEDNAFENCGNLGKIDAPNLTEMGAYAFSNCMSLTNVSAPKLKKIAPFAFFKSKMIDATFAVADTIGKYAFALANANSISCPKVKYVGNGAFSVAYRYRVKDSSSWNSYFDVSECTENRVVSVSVPSVEVICDSAFYSQDMIEKLVSPNLKSIGEYAFAAKSINFWGGDTWYYYDIEKSKLSSIDFASVTTISKYAFYNCDSLKSISLPNVTRIEEGTFNRCNFIKSLDAPRVTYIGTEAFCYASNLQTANISKADSVCLSAFNGCSKLQAVNLPKINYIGNNAFNGCSSVKTIDLSDKLTELGENCFYGCTGVETLTLPASITKIPTQCFAGSNNIKTINCNAPAPPMVGETPFNMQTLYTAKLRVPESSIVLYQADNYWKHFYYYETNPDVLTDLILSNVTDMGDVRMEKVNLTLKAGASLAMTGNDAQSFRSVLFMANSNESGMFISKSERITSDATKIELDMPALKWRFITLPYDVNISDIERSVEDAQMAIYKYDGSKRASSGTGYAWTRVNSGTLTAGTGYIIQTSKATALTFPAPYAHKDKPFQPYDVTTKLAANTSSTAANQGWNFVGNPYMAYYDISKLELNAPITVWNGTTYNAYSPKDDEYALRPMQPFFVQCPANVKSLKFNADGCQATSVITKATEARARYNAKDNVERKVVDIAISTEGETQADRTRFVINNKATDDYELSCDAAKMMSMDENVAQIYTVSRGIQYAINEGPQLTGKVVIGIVTPKAGKYTLNALRSDMDVMLHDEETGETVNLTEGAYTFEAGEGVNESRFYVVLGNETTKVAGVAADGINGATEVYDLDGRRKDEATKGVNIIRQNGKVSKQMNR